MPTSNSLVILKTLYSHTFARWLCNLTKSSKIRSEGLACQQLTSEHNNSTCMQREWERRERQLTVTGRPMLSRAASISEEEHRCWRDFLSILRFPMKAEFTWKSRIWANLNGSYKHGGINFNHRKKFRFGTSFCTSWPHDPLLTIEKKLLGELTGGYSSGFFSLKLITAPSTCEWNWPRTV